MKKLKLLLLIVVSIALLSRLGTAEAAQARPATGPIPPGLRVERLAGVGDAGQLRRDQELKLVARSVEDFCARTGEPVPDAEELCAFLAERHDDVSGPFLEDEEYFYVVLPSGKVVLVCHTPTIIQIGAPDDRNPIVVSVEAGVLL